MTGKRLIWLVVIYKIKILLATQVYTFPVSRDMLASQANFDPLLVSTYKEPRFLEQNVCSVIQKKLFRFVIILLVWSLVVRCIRSPA